MTSPDSGLPRIGPPVALPERMTEGALVVRRWTDDDATAMDALIRSSLGHLRPWMAWAQHEPITIPSRRSMFARWDRRREAGHGAVYGAWHDETLIGGCGLHRRVGPGGLDLGYWLGAPATGRGHATAIAGLLTREALELDGVEFVQISHDTSNVRSGNVARRLGYTQDATRTASVTTWRKWGADEAHS